MWHRLSIRWQLIMLLSTLFLIFEAGALGLTLWFDIQARKSLAVEQARTLGRTLNHDLIKVLLNPQAESYSDITFRLSGFDAVRRTSWRIVPAR